METADRRERARRAVDGDIGGPGAPVRAMARALARLDNAVAVVLVEGISDQIALDTAAVGRGLDLEAERVVVVPLGGAHGIGRFLTDLGPLRSRVRLAGLCDLREAEIFRRGLVRSRVGSPGTVADLEDLGFFVCVEDLEDELIRALGTAAVEVLLDSQGDLGPFRTFQSQPAWSGRRPEAQLRRFLGSGARRKLRYARLLVEAAVDRDLLPRPLEALLTVAAIAAWQQPGNRPGPRHTSDLADIVDLLLATGARIGEILALRWKDLDLGAARATATFCGTLVYVKGKGYYRQPWTKTNAGYRTVTLPRFATDMLLRRQVNATGNPDAIFCSRRGTWLSPHNVRRQWREVRKDAGLEWVTPPHLPQDRRHPARPRGRHQDRRRPTRPRQRRDHQHLLHREANQAPDVFDVLQILGSRVSMA